MFRDPPFEESSDVIAVPFLHHQVAVAAQAMVLEPQMDGSHACLNEIIDGAVVVHGPGRRLRCHDSNGYQCQVGKTPRRLFLNETIRQPRLLSLTDFAPQFSWAFE